MIWVSLVLAIINLIIKLPDIIALIKKILERLHQMPPRIAAGEARKLLKAVNLKLAMHSGLQAAAAVCPLVEYLAGLDERHP